jgi:hypothetical protein
MKIYEAIKILQKMNPNEDVFLQFTEDVTEYRNNEHLKTNRNEESEYGHSKRRPNFLDDGYYNQNESK